jgi:hypothetical protein
VSSSITSMRALWLTPTRDAIPLSVIPDARESARSGIQMQSLSLLLDSRFAS